MQTGAAVSEFWQAPCVGIRNRQLRIRRRIQNDAIKRQVPDIRALSAISPFPLSQEQPVIFADLRY